MLQVISTISKVGRESSNQLFDDPVSQKNTPLGNMLKSIRLFGLVLRTFYKRHDQFTMLMVIINPLSN